MSYKLIICPEAELDIQDAFEWYEAQTLGLGSEFVRAVVMLQCQIRPIAVWVFECKI
uniref:Plasmid stabilization system n=1 Tax=Cyanothece sp. (strain PCC 7425 / ATCC 29141) TaxID=395961 RepID=B8HPF4_CYAP4